MQNDNINGRGVVGNADSPSSGFILGVMVGDNTGKATGTHSEAHDADRVVNPTFERTCDKQNR